MLDLDYKQAAAQLADLIASIKYVMDFEPLASRPDWDKNAAHVRFTLKSERLPRPFVGEYSAGSGIWAKDPPYGAFVPARRDRWIYLAANEEVIKRAKANWRPEPFDVIAALLHDCSGADQSFDDWASDYGYDTDSRKAERAYNACRDTMFTMRRLFGAEYDRAVELANLM